MGDFKNAEIYYLKGLKIKPKHLGINEYLGELYVQTNRIDLAKQRLEVIKNCNCEEYEELKELIDDYKELKELKDDRLQRNDKPVKRTVTSKKK